MGCTAALPFISGSRVTMSNRSHKNGAVRRAVLLSGGTGGRLVGTILCIDHSTICGSGRARSFNCIPNGAASTRTTSGGGNRCFGCCNGHGMNVVTNGFSRCSFGRASGAANGVLPGPSCLGRGGTGSFLGFNVAPSSSATSNIDNGCCAGGISNGRTFHIVCLRGNFRASRLFRSSSATTTVRFVIGTFGVGASLRSNSRVCR